ELLGIADGHELVLDEDLVDVLGPFARLVDVGRTRLDALLGDPPDDGAELLQLRRKFECRLAHLVWTRLARVPDDQRVALSASAADAGAAELHAAPAHLVGERQDQPGTARADRMAERDRAAVHVDELLGDAE